MQSDSSEACMKVLLKQVYAAHSGKVKSLEEEITQLKNKLSEAERKIKNLDSECKRCAELEKAFNSCKSVLHEQTKWFESLGQRFSVFNNQDATVIDKTSTTSDEGISSPEAIPNIKLTSSTKQNLLKNLMTLSYDFSDSLDLCSAPFPAPHEVNRDFSTLNCDSLVLAPDTLDVGDELKKQKSDATLKFAKDECKKVQDKVHLKSVKSSREGSGKSQNDPLRTATDPTEETLKTTRDDEETFVQIPGDQEKLENTQNDQKKLKNNPVKEDTKFIQNGQEKIEAESMGGKKKSVKPTKDDQRKSKITEDSQSQNLHVKDAKRETKSGKKRSSTESDFEEVPLKASKRTNVTSDWYVGDSKTSDAVDEPKTSKNEAQDKRNKIKNLENSFDDGHTKCPRKKITPALNISVCKDVTNSKLLNQENKKLCDENVKDSSYEVSPSLLPPSKIKNVLLKQSSTEDIDDFQSPVLSKKTSSEEDETWTACNKKKNKKQPSIKFLKTNSKHRMQLTSLPPNYKKPNYKQTKLSKSIFMPKVSNSSNKDDIDCIVELVTDKPAAKTSISADFDATCIPDNFIYDVSSHSAKDSEVPFDTESGDSVEFVHSLDESSNDAPIPSPVICSLPRIKEQSNGKDSKPDVCTAELSNSFDRLPRKEEPNFKYKEETVRRKDDRKQLNAFECQECEKYYSDLGLSDQEKQQRLKKCSRHRAKFAPPTTPENFWELEFPDTQECKARGYMDVTQKGKLKSHRRRPLEL